MNAREAMQALLDGKTLYKRTHDGRYLFKLNEDGQLETKFEDKLHIGNSLNTIDGIYEEYPLTFEQALREMLDGKVVVCEAFDNRKYFFSDDWFQFKSRDYDWFQVDWFEGEMRDAKWKVVE